MSHMNIDVSENVRCPVCNKEFTDKLELKTKPAIYLYIKDGLFTIEDSNIVRAKYPCPKCRSEYYTPIRHEGTWAICRCPIHGEWRVSFLRSFKFRKLCSIVASKPNKSPEYYTPPERQVKAILDKLGVSYEHNKEFRNGNRRYYVDFYVSLSNPGSLVIEVSPSIWHSRWNRELSEERKREYFQSKGIEYIELTERNKSKWEDIIRRALDR